MLRSLACALALMFLPSLAHAAPVGAAPQCTTIASFPHPSPFQSLHDPAAWREMVAYTADTPTFMTQIFVHDFATGNTVPITNGAQYDRYPTFVDDGFMVYLGGWNQMVAYWFGPDVTPGTTDDATWTFDTTQVGYFSRPHANGAEVAYVSTDQIAGTHDVRRCDMFVGTTEPCWSGFVRTVTPLNPTYYAHEAYPIAGSVVWSANGASADHLFYWDRTAGETTWITSGWGVGLFDVTGPLALLNRMVWPVNEAVLTVVPASPPPVVYQAYRQWHFQEDAAIARNVGSDNHLKIARIERPSGSGYPIPFYVSASKWGASTTSVPVGGGTVYPRAQYPEIAIDGDLVAYHDNVGIGVDRCIIR